MEGLFSSLNSSGLDEVGFDQNQSLIHGGEDINETSWASRFALRACFFLYFALLSWLVDIRIGLFVL